MADVEVDLSHLTEEERRQIQQVLDRQKNEEEKDKAVVQNLAAEVKQMEQRVQQQVATLGAIIQDPENQGLCQICQKVKSADGIGHRCYKCNIHTCPRCGGRVPIHHSNKMQWLCVLCKKKQDLAKKSAAWYHGDVGQLIGSDNQQNMPPSQRNNHNGPHQQPQQNGRGHHPSSSAGPHAPLRRQGSLDPRSQYPGAPGQSGQQQRQQSLRRHETIDHSSFQHQQSFRDQNARQPSSRQQRDPSMSRGDGPQSRVPPEYPVRRPESQNDVRKRQPESSDAYPSRMRRRTQSQDRFNMSEYAADFDPRRGAYEQQWEYSKRRNPAPYGLNDYPANYVPESGHDRRRMFKQTSFSSSEDELLSNWSEYSVNDEGSIHSYRSEASIRTHPGLRHLARPQRGRLGRMNSEDPDYYSGYASDTRSPNVDWRPSKSGRHLIGHMILRKNFNDLSNRSRNSAKMLGIQLEGGRMNANGRMTAVITKIKPGSVGHVVGNLRVGDTVLEWNRIPLTDRSYEEVANILIEDADEPEVELLVSRKLPDRYAQNNPPEMFGGANRAGRFSPRPAPRRSFDALPLVSGRIQMSFFYSHQHMHLAVTVLRGAELILRPDQTMRNPYVILYLLPDRNEQSRRRSKCCSKTNDPEWNETFYFHHIKESELDDLAVEVTVWDYDRYSQSNNEFLGESVIQIATVHLNDEPAWFYLSYPESEMERRPGFPSGYDDPSLEGLSPAGSSLSRMSDSIDYVSDPDLLDGMERRRRQYPGHGGANDYGLARASPRYQPEDPRQMPTQSGRHDMNHRMMDDRSIERRGRRDYPEEEGIHRNRQSGRRAHHSAPPVNDDMYEYDDCEGSLPSSSAHSNMNSGRSKRQLPTLPSSQLLGAPQPSSSRRSSMTITAENAEQPSSPSYRRDSSPAKQPITQVHNTSLKVPNLEEVPKHPPKLDQLLNNNSQEENIDPMLAGDAITLGSNLKDRPGSFRHSRSASRRSHHGQSQSLSRSSEPTGGADLALLAEPETQRRLSESLPRMTSVDVSEMDILTDKPYKSAAKVLAEIDALEQQILAQQGSNKPGQKAVSSKAAAILGLKKDNKTPAFLRSEEVGHQSPSMVRAAMSKQISKDSTDGSVSSGGGRSRGHHHLVRDSQLANFIEPLGPGQVVNRQVLASPCLGQLLLCFKYDRSKVSLCVTVSRGRGYLQKTGISVLPATYVKLVLMEDKKIIAKQKTSVARRCLDPLYNQDVFFNEVVDNRHLHVTVWGDYGRMDKKCFMGCAVINLGELELHSAVITGWYTLYGEDTLITPAGKTNQYNAGRPFEER